MRVYHGSTIAIEHPIAAAGRRLLDFGQGFYVTDIKMQADSWAELMQRIREEAGIVNVYELDMDRVKATFLYYRFEHYDNEWLQFIVANRMGRKDVEYYDVVEGGVANDRVIDAVEFYLHSSTCLVVRGCLELFTPHFRLLSSGCGQYGILRVLLQLAAVVFRIRLGHIR